MCDVFLDCLSPEIREEYVRVKRTIGNEDPYAGPDTLGIIDVLKAHFLIADFFLAEGSGIGGVGPRDMDLLHSALYRQVVGFGGVRRYRTIHEICATLLFGLVKNHAFHDANKRTGFLSAIYYLYKHNRIPTVRHKSFENFIVKIADGTIARHEQVVRDREGGVEDAEIQFIARYIKHKTREVDKRFYTITYRDLLRILNRFGCKLENPHGNYIDVINQNGHKVINIGFPGWTSQVNQKAISSVRRNLNLTHEHGIDSQTFYRGLERLDELIAHYQGPLKNLAGR